MNLSRLTKAAILTLGVVGWGQLAQAGAIPYPYSTANPTTYTFTAPTAGDVVAYFSGYGGAVYEDKIGMLDNGVLTTAGYGLDNHASYEGQSFDFGTVKAGDTLTFVLENLSVGNKLVYSNPALNAGYDSVGTNHVYSTSYIAGGGLGPLVPTGTYVAFEDMFFPVSDYNYWDDTFVFTVPEPASLALFATGLVALYLVRRRWI